MVDAVEWQPFFVKSALGAFALLLVLGVAEALTQRR
jgi:hypothetical protein